VDNILARIELQLGAYGKEENLPGKLFEVLKEQRAGLEALKEKYGSIIAPEQLEAESGK
jgi:phosphoenolpyruvate carboxykinase (GTP)